MSTLEFETRFDPDHGRPVQVAENVMRVTAPNTGPFTFKGTNSYIVGKEQCVVIDPGPDNSDHLEALVSAIDGRSVSHILVSHTHADHSPLARRLKDRLGGVIAGADVHHPARKLFIGEINPLDASVDHDHVPDRVLKDGHKIEWDGFAIEAVATPGHTANHMAFSLAGTGILFSGDHVMGWATSIVAPPDGSMAQYMASLDKLLSRDDDIYLPGHGGAISSPAKYVRGLKAHRKMRERAILDRIGKGDRTIAEIVAAIYRDTPARLHGAAALTILAHLEDLCGRGLVTTDGDVRIDGSYRPAVPISASSSTP